MKNGLCLSNYLQCPEVWNLLTLTRNDLAAHLWITHYSVHKNITACLILIVTWSYQISFKVIYLLHLDTLNSAFGSPWCSIVQCWLSQEYWKKERCQTSNSAQSLLNDHLWPISFLTKKYTLKKISHYPSWYENWTVNRFSCILNIKTCWGYPLINLLLRQCWNVLNPPIHLQNGTKEVSSCKA